MSGETGSILWRRLDSPGHESARIVAEESGWRLMGSAVFVHEAKPCRLEYSILCDGQWNSRSADIAGWVGDSEVNKQVEVNGEAAWRLNGELRPAVSGCIDLDLNF